MSKSVLVEFLPGNGKSYMLPVKYIARYAINDEGNCSFCNGDPLGEDPQNLLIREYMENGYAEYCPFCEGRN